MSKNKFKPAREWFNQADYDLKTADAMFRTGRYIYTVFMCHLSIEKVLKGLYAQKFNETPPKIHNLLYFIEKIKLKPSEDLYDFIFSLNRVSIPTRYPDDLHRMLSDYNQKSTKILLRKSKEVLKWSRIKLKEQSNS